MSAQLSYADREKSKHLTWSWRSEGFWRLRRGGRPPNLAYVLEGRDGWYAQGVAVGAPRLNTILHPTDVDTCKELVIAWAERNGL